jgi:hypothetical protein
VPQPTTLPRALVVIRLEYIFFSEDTTIADIVNIVRYVNEFHKLNVKLQIPSLIRRLGL